MLPKAKRGLYGTFRTGPLLLSYYVLSPSVQLKHLGVDQLVIFILNDA